MFKGRKTLYNRKLLLSDSGGKGVWNLQSCWVTGLSTTFGLFCFRCGKNIWRIWDGWGEVGKFNLSHFLPKVTSPNIHSGSLKSAYWERTNFQVSYWYSRYARLYTYIYNMCVRCVINRQILHLSVFQGLEKRIRLKHAPHPMCS